MIIYEPGKWSVGFAFGLKGSVFPKAIVWAMPCSLMALFYRYIFSYYPEKIADWGIHEIGDANVYNGFTFILGFLVVFRSQQAYSRWWEGGTLLQQLRGEWFNSYSCLLAFCNADKDKEQDVEKFKHQLVRLFSLLYGCALQQVSTLQEKKFELLNIDGLGIDSLRFLQDCPDRCEVALQWIQRLIVESEANGILKIAPPILSRVYNELGNGIVNLNNARKITEFPIPFPLAQMITVMLLFHAMITPLICAAVVQTTYWAFIITFVVISSYWSINYIAVELEMPFGDDLNDLPLYEMQKDMNCSLSTLVSSDLATKVPTFDFVEEIHCRMSIKEVDFNGDLIDYDACTDRGAWKLNELSKSNSRLRGVRTNRSSRCSNVSDGGLLKKEPRPLADTFTQVMLDHEQQSRPQRKSFGATSGANQVTATEQPVAGGRVDFGGAQNSRAEPPGVCVPDMSSCVGRQSWATHGETVPAKGREDGRDKVEIVMQAVVSTGSSLHPSSTSWESSTCQVGEPAEIHRQPASKVPTPPPPAASAARAAPPEEVPVLLPSSCSSSYQIPNVSSVADAAPSLTTPDIPRKQGPERAPSQVVISPSEETRENEQDFNSAVRFSNIQFGFLKSEDGRASGAGLQETSSNPDELLQRNKQTADKALRHGELPLSMSNTSESLQTTPSQ